MSNCLNPVHLLSFDVPCGKCYNCLMRYSFEWATRCVDELKANNNVGCFLTLTYAETDGKLCRKDLQNFLKRLRKYISPQKVRYFGCGEYGGKGNRPHYHLLLFGWRPNDLVQISKKFNIVYYRSDIISQLWGLGFVSVGDITFESAKYCAKYLQKMDDRYHEVKPFTCMSLKPGIGYKNIGFDDLFREKKYIDGKELPLPRYYVRRMEIDGYNVDMLKLHRQQIAKMKCDEYRQPATYEDFKEEEQKILEKLNKKIVKQY